MFRLVRGMFAEGLGIGGLLWVAMHFADFAPAKETAVAEATSPPPASTPSLSAKSFASSPFASPRFVSPNIEPPRESAAAPSNETLRSPAASESTFFRGTESLLSRREDRVRYSNFDGR